MSHERKIKRESRRSTVKNLRKRSRDLALKGRTRVRDEARTIRSTMWFEVSVDEDYWNEWLDKESDMHWMKQDDDFWRNEYLDYYLDY